LTPFLPYRQSGFPYRLIDTINFSHRQIYAGNSNCPKRGLSAGPEKYQRDTQYYHQFKSAEPGILFSAFYRSAERIIRDEDRVGEN